ncbi:MAG: hybrid sensor histidine kinase/response regulator [Desulfobacteraceae bacterium]|nr:MAG: hybrid sensor histidine kinase/response regulator [Desulfobacteraceae bacterium]
MTIQTDENLRLYVEESLEHLADIENDLLSIERSGAEIDEERVNKVFRAAHSIKGGAGFMGLTRIKELSHKMENVLGMIRSRELVPNQEIINVLLSASDTLRNLLGSGSASNDADVSIHTEALTAIAAGNLSPQEHKPGSEWVDISFPNGKAGFRVSEPDIARVRKEGKFIYLIEFDLIHDVQRKGKTPLGLIEELIKGGVLMDCKIDIESIGSLEEAGMPDRLPFWMLFASVLEPDMIGALVEVAEENIHPVDAGSAGMKADKPVEVPEAAPDGLSSREDASGKAPEPIDREESDEHVLPAASKENPKEKDVRANAGSETSLRVSVNLLDSLMNLAGELVLGRNQLLQAIATKDTRCVEVAGQRLNLITTELQEAIMLTRMQPIGSVFNKFPRVVRDLARDLDKQVELNLEGKDVELDKTIIEAINDPLTHLVRNSVDHGIETPEERKRLGKPAVGKVSLRAYHEAGQVNIEISDDGKGIDGAVITGAAVTKGLLSEERAQLLSEKEKINLIFLPGFSTAKKVTDVSGRGVGMDVVKTNLDRLGGVVDIDSDPGRGTTIRIKLPLTLAIIPSQIVTVGGERFAVPQVNMDELLRIPASQVKERVERVGDAEVVRLRGQLLPLLSLAEVLEIERTYIDPNDGIEKPDRRKEIADRRSRKSPMFKTGDSGDEPQKDDEKRSGADRRYRAQSAVNIVVVSTGALKYGLVVDQLHDSEEIVVKPLGRHLMQCKGYAGATIMGDGRVALILDVVGLAHMADLISVEASDRAAAVAQEAHREKEDSQSLLIFRNSEDEQFAVPLSLVQRIEKIKRCNLEEVGGKRVIQYRGGALPLSAIEQVANVKPLADKEELIVIVFLIADREAGLLATGPVDAIDVPAVFDESTLKQTGILGSSIIGGQTTLLVDIYGIMKELYPHWFSEREAVRKVDGTAETILYAEDSGFFRDQVRGFIENEGYTVIEATNGAEAWNLLQEHAGAVSLVITDIEMPELDGYGLSKKIRGDERFSHLPVIALTTLAGEEDIAKGKASGVNDYQVKLDRERLMESICRHLKAA